MCTNVPNFSRGSVSLNRGPHTCEASTLPSESSPQTQVNFIFKMVQQVRPTYLLGSQTHPVCRSQRCLLTTTKTNRFNCSILSHFVDCLKENVKINRLRQLQLLKTLNIFHYWFIFHPGYPVCGLPILSLECASPTPVTGAFCSVAQP